MAEKVGDAYVELGTRDQQLTAGLSRGLRAVQGFAVAASGIFAGVAAARGVLGFTKAAQTQEDAVEGLASALRVYGEDVKSLLPQLTKFASSIQKVTKFGDESTLALMTSIRNLGVQGSALQQATKDAIGLATALNMDSKTAARYTALAKQGEFTILQRYVPALRTATTQSEKLAIVTELMNRGFKQAQDQAKTTSGVMAQIANNAGDVREEVGFLALKFASADANLKSLNESLAALAERLRNVSGAQIQTTKDIVMFVTALTAAVTVGKRLAPIIAQLTTNVAAMAAQGGLAAAIGKTSLLVAAAVGVAAITKKLIEMRHATNVLIESAEILNDTLAAQEARFGTSSTEALRRRRREMQAAGIDTRTGEPAGAAGGGGGGGGGGRGRRRPGTRFAFTSLESAVKNIQTGAGKDPTGKEQKKQTGFLSSIDQGIQKVIEEIGTASPVGV